MRRISRQGSPEPEIQRVQVDEIWSFTYAKQRNVEDAKAAPAGAGDTWTWVGIDADTKLAVTWHVGGRNAVCAWRFMIDLASRIDTRTVVHRSAK